MIRNLTIILSIFCFVLEACLTSDKERIPKGYSKLTIVIDDSANFYTNNVIVKTDTETFKLFIDYDSVRKTRIYVYDSLKNNDYEITLSSFLNRNFKLPLTLVKDTVLIIEKSQLQNFDTTNEATNLLSGLQKTDTLCIAYASIGCFHNYSNKTVIYKNQNGFTAEFTTDTSRDSKKQQIVSIKRHLPTSFIDILRKLELGCMEGYSRQQVIIKYCDKELSKAKNEWDSLRASWRLYNSTTSSAIYLNRGNMVFTLSNNGINDIPFYDEFMSALKLQ